MFRSQVMVILAFCACGLLFAAEPETPAKQADKGSGSLGDIPVPKDHTRLLKTFSPDKKLFAIFFRDGFDKIISIHDAAYTNLWPFRDPRPFEISYPQGVDPFSPASKRSIPKRSPPGVSKFETPAASEWPGR